MDARTLGSIALLLASVAASGLPRAAEAATCDALVGKWTWFTGGVVSINADGTMRHEPGNDGTWECTDRARGQATLRWRIGGYVNRLVLSGDGRALSSTDPAQSYVTARKVDSPRPAEAPRPADPPRSAEVPKAKTPEPPRRADAEVPKAKPSEPPRRADAETPAKPPESPTRSGPEVAKPKAPEAPRDVSAPARTAGVACVGTACPSLRVDSASCKVTHTGTQPLQIRAYSGQRIVLAPMPLTPGRVFDLPECAALTRIEAVYQTESFPAATKSEAAGPGPCAGAACVFVKIMTTDGCVWIRSGAPDVVHVELRLQGETVTMTLEQPDATKVAKVSDSGGRTPREVKQAAARKRLDELRQKGMNIPYDPKVEGPRSAPQKVDSKDKGQAWHGTAYDAFRGSDVPIFNARVNRASGCVTKPEEILTYRARLASAKGKVAEGPPVECVGDACRDLEYGPEEIAACHLVNQGGREIAVGIVKSGSREPSISASVAPGRAVRLEQPLLGCLSAKEIGRIEARYK
jgi:hypothetical protein